MNDTKSKFWLYLSWVLIATSLPLAAEAVESGDRLSVGRVTGLHLRAQAGRRSQSLDVMRSGTALVATGRTRRGWTEVKAGDQRGWVKDDYITEARTCVDCRSEANENPILKAGREIVTAAYKGVLNYADKLGRFFGVGHSVAAYKCWRAVWEVLKHAGLVRGDLTQRLAKNAFKDLKKFGFHHDPRACKTPGVVRVYGASKPGHGLGTPGDYAGHIEIFGKDGRYHHFTASRQPMNERVGNQTRPLLYCLIK